ncbi:DUF397 domain-containing protein [Streptomyces halstedii]|uniref:DUF397 domain-containing protein n=1 Tax=Streptomyces TaxID=1883 RepID=UPI00080590A2|nr:MULTISPECIES: DUF397 domain-containing protein [unclassified Streptomyces]MYR75302.1 DUF397 domain-containing protein [Streptomyces sp. SID4925]SBU87936.1 protein of unknown function (DUF397) [Streptomyces sp. OspMP-M45]
MTERTVPHSSSPNGWRKSSYSNSEAGSCVEVIDHHPTAVPVRDSKVPSGPTLLVPAASWASFVSALKTDLISP